MRKNKMMRRLLFVLLFIFILMNVVAFFHAYRFTHFSSRDNEKTKPPSTLSTGEKLQTLFFGIKNPRPVNGGFPSQPFQTVTLQSNKRIECWYIKTVASKGTVILFHGYGGEKSSLIDKSDAFIKLGYNTLLVDFMGSGGSEGNQTTLGFKEAQEVKTSFDYIAATGEKNIMLFGTSLGAVAITKSIKDYNLNPAAITIECPFGSMYQTTCARFHTMKIPVFPMAGLLVFWGGIQNGFWAFGHKPVEYAKFVQCPTLLLYGEQDEKVSREEINSIFSNLAGRKQLKTFSQAGHENYLLKYKHEWIETVSAFIEKK